MKKAYKNLLQEALSFTKENKAKNLRIICVFAPFFSDAKEGYLQRVQAIDEEVLAPNACIHIDFESKSPVPQALRKTQRHLLINLPPFDKDAIDCAVQIEKLCSILYIHSVMRAMESMIGKDVTKLFKVKNLYKIWDVHGAVPEEYVMQSNFLQAQNATAAEELLLQEAHCIVVISDAMKQHFETKYNLALSNTINTSVFNTINVDFEKILSHKGQSAPWTIAYAGNTMPWQNISLMKDTIARTGESFQYQIFTSNPPDFHAQNATCVLPSTCCVKTASAHEVLLSYEQYHLGFVLRDDSAVNRVACPTKLMEYIQFGLIPILKSSQIGDFVALGLTYIPYEDLPSFTMTFSQYKAIARKNAAIVQTLQAQHEQGIYALKKILA